MSDANENEDVTMDLSVMDPEEIQQTVRELDEKYEFISPDMDYTQDDIQELFNYINAVVFLSQWEKGARILRDMKLVIDEYFLDAVNPEMEEKPDVEVALDFLVDWHMLSLRFTPETRKDFSDVEHYRELLHAFDQAPAKFRISEIRAKLQMIHHYKHWLGRGGDVDALSDEDYEMLEGMSNDYMDELNGMLAEKENEEAWDDLISVKRTLFKYFSYRGKPNDAIATLKELMTLVPKKEGYHPSDLADLQMELAKIYLKVITIIFLRQFSLCHSEIVQSTGHFHDHISDPLSFESDEVLCYS